MCRKEVGIYPLIKSSPASFKNLVGVEKDVSEESVISDASNESPNNLDLNSGKNLSILWKGKIIEPFYRQLIDFRGNLNGLLEALGRSMASPRQSKFKKIRIEWIRKVLWASPSQILEVEGDLYRLERIVHHRRHRRHFCGQ